MNRIPKVNYIKVYLNGKKCSEYTLSDKVELSSVLPMIENHKVYSLNYLFKNGGKFYFSKIFDYYILKQGDKFYLFKTKSKNEELIYLHVSDDFLLYPDNLSTKLVIMETDLKYYQILIQSTKFEKTIHLLTHKTINLMELVQNKLYLYDFDLVDIIYEKTSYLSKNYNFHTVTCFNKILILVNAKQRNLSNRFICFLNHKLLA